MPNPNYNSTITIYNRISSKDSGTKKEQWQRNVLSHCFFKMSMTQNQSGTESSNKNTYIVRIPQTEKYKPYEEWVTLEEEERNNYFTISLGDIIIKNEVLDIIDGNAGNTATQVLNRHKPNGFRITSLSDNTKFMYGRHFKVGG